MAKGKSTRGSAYGTPSSLTKLLALNKPATRALVTQPTLQYLAPAIQQEAEYVRSQSDRRTYHPLQRLRPPGATPRSAGRLVSYSHPVTDVGGPPRGIAFNIPNRVAICVRRKVRREVIHALRLRHKGAGSKRTRNAYSGIKC